MVLCGNHECDKSEGYICAKGLDNPNWGITNFDDIGASFLTVFQCLTGEGWSFIMYILWNSYPRSMVTTYFLILILFGVFFVLNLFLAVIKNNFGKENQKVLNERKKFQKKMDIMKEKARAIIAGEDA